MIKIKYETNLNMALRDLIFLNKNICAELVNKEAAKPGSILEPRRCPVCGEATYKNTISNGFFKFRRCADCTLLYMNPVFKDEVLEKENSDEDRYLHAYWQLMQKYMKFNDFNDAPNPKNHPILRDLVIEKPSGRLLDVGCSIGNFLMAARHFYDVEGVEINIRTANIAKSRGLKVHINTLEKIEGEGVYDIITMNQLFYGLKYPLKLMEESSRLLKKDGILYVNTPNADSLSMRLFNGDNCNVVGKTNLNVFNMKSLDRMASMTGFIFHKFYTEWLDIFMMDICAYLLMKKKFIHRRNHHLPFYEKAVTFEEKFQGALLGNRFKKNGSYCVCIMRKNVL